VTLIVGILCRDGVVMASDSAATFGAGGRPTIGQQIIRKVHRLNEHVLFSSTGAVGMAQLLADKVASLWGDGTLSGSKCPTPESAMDRIGKEVIQLVGPYLQTAQLQQNITGDASSSLCKSLVALPVGHVPCLFNFDYNGAPERSTPELPFISMGIGQAIADPFLALLHRLLWKAAEPTVAEGRLAAVWTIEHVSQTNPGGVGGGVQLATLSAGSDKLPSVTMVSDEDVEEHRQKIAAAEHALIAEIRGGPGSLQTPTVPTPS
jgi:hypothetical protein